MAVPVAAIITAASAAAPLLSGIGGKRKGAGGGGTGGGKKPDVASIATATVGLFGALRDIFKRRRPAAEAPKGAPPDAMSDAARAVIDGGGWRDLVPLITQAAPGALASASRDETLAYVYAALFRSGRAPVMPGAYGYVPGVTEQAYAAMGVDYRRTTEAFRSGQGQYIMLPSGGTAAVPRVAVERLREEGRGTSAVGGGAKAKSSSATWMVVAAVAAAVLLLLRR